jgi:queuine/archaeosine tRNA-ribosyltransferase
MFAFYLQTSPANFFLGTKYNFNSEDLLNSYFMVLIPGLSVITRIGHFAVNFEAGKRFKLTDSAPYRPFVGFTAVANSGVSCFIAPMSFSVQLQLFE